MPDELRRTLRSAVVPVVKVRSPWLRTRDGGNAQLVLGLALLELGSEVSTQSTPSNQLSLPFAASEVIKFLSARLPHSSMPWK